MGIFKEPVMANEKLTPSEKLKAAAQITAVLDATVEGPNADREGADILVLALKSRVSMDILRATFCGQDASVAMGHLSL
jgi:hypothetical protein